MNVSVILAHPKKGSFNHVIAETAAESLASFGHRVALRDLYAEGFDPVLMAEEIPFGSPLAPQIEEHCQQIAQADGIVIVHPNWWGQPPAILKGWVDRVLRAGVAYRFVEGDSGAGAPIGLLRAKAALVFNTTDTPADRELETFGDPLDTLWKRCILGYCGVGTVVRRSFGVMVASTPELREAWLSVVIQEVRTHFGK